MVKEEFIEKLEQKAYIDIVKDYCLENNKPADKVDIFISMAYTMGFINNLIPIVLSYYLKKYEISTLIDANNNIIKYIY